MAELGSSMQYTSISLNDDTAVDYQHHAAPRISAGSAAAAPSMTSSASTGAVHRPTSLFSPRLGFTASQQQQQQQHHQRQQRPPPLQASHLLGDNDGATEEAEVVTADDANGEAELGDSYNLVYLSMVLAGIGFLLPYNSYVNAVDFYQQRFNSHLIVFDISMTYITVMLLSVFLTNLLVTRVHLRWRITFGYMVSIVVLFLTTFFDIILNVFPTNWSYGLTLSSAAVVSLGCTIQQSSFYGYASLLPRRFTQAVMLGESCAGFIVSLSRLLTKGAVASVKPSTALFFIMTSCMLLLCLLTFTLAVKSQYVRQFIQPTGSASGRLSSGCDPHHRQRPSRHSSSVPEDRVRMLPEGQENPAYQAEMQDLNLLEELNQQPHLVTTPTSSTSDAVASAAASTADAVEEARPVASDQTPTPGGGAPRHQGWSSSQVHLSVEAGLQLRLTVANSIWLYMAAIALCYLVTLSLFPGIESEIPSCRLRDWMPIVLMAVFNGSDLVGKLLAAIPVAWRGAPLLMCSLFRFCLIPLFMSSASPRQKPHISSESWAYFITAVLGLSNGYFGSLPMISAPKTVQSSHREIAGNLMTLSYSVGLTAGSGISYWLDDLLGPMPAKLQTWEYACGMYNVSGLIGR